MNNQSFNRVCKLPCDGSPRSNVLGVGVSAVNMDQSVHRCMALIESSERGYVCVTGVHGVMEAQRDERFRSILNKAYLCVPDGMPTVWMGRFQGHHEMSRVYGPDFMIALCRAGVAQGYRHFFYGGKPGVAEHLRNALAKRIPGLQVTGTYTPPFRALNQCEEEDFAEKLRYSEADVLWVGLSTPKQERFMAAYSNKLPVKLMVGVGAAFDVHTGGIRDAPHWIQMAGLQWLHRLMQEPQRLGKRYLRNNPEFLVCSALQLAGLKKFSLPVPSEQRRPQG
jgi:N-acetylglucosaminyldiphosphoundecaprenol N-acetyl-beta-D-mannosaminyltransferase